MPAVRLHLLDGPLEQHWERLGSLPYWGHPWPGGQALARHLLAHPGLVADLRVLDLASGSGLVAVAAARAGAARVHAADVDRLARAAIALNARANEVRLEVIAHDLLDHDVADGRAGAAAPAFDVVLAGDACYEPELARRLLRYLHRAADAGALVLLGDPGRAHLDTAGLWRVAGYDVPTPEGVERGAVTRTTVWRVPPTGGQFRS